MKPITKVNELTIDGYEIEYGWAYGTGVVNGLNFSISVNVDDVIYVTWEDGTRIPSQLEQFLIAEVRKDFPTLVN